MKQIPRALSGVIILSISLISTIPISGQNSVPAKEIAENSDSVKARELEEVVISGSTNYIKLNGNNISVDISHSPLGDMPSTEDLLAQLPFVKDQDGSFYVAGRGKAVIYIGNRKIQDSAELTELAQPT